MNRYSLICRLRGPAFLILAGVLALLHEAHVLSWSHSWPLFLILWGVLKLAERAAWAEMDSGYPAGGSYPGQPSPGGNPAPPPGTAIVPAPPSPEPGNPPGEWRP